MGNIHFKYIQKPDIEHNYLPHTNAFSNGTSLLASITPQPPLCQYIIIIFIIMTQWCRAEQYSHHCNNGTSLWHNAGITVTTVPIQHNITTTQWCRAEQYSHHCSNRTSLWHNAGKHHTTVTTVPIHHNNIYHHDTMMQSRTVQGTSLWHNAVKHHTTVTTMPVHYNITVTIQWNITVTADRQGHNQYTV